MNIIRTKAVELSAIPAIAYKQKLASGGAGIKILRLDKNSSAVATIDKRSGDAVPYGKPDSGDFPAEAFDEALDLLEGLPYSSRGKIHIAAAVPEKPEKPDEHETEKEKVVDSDEYRALIERYTDEKGKLNYQLMNKDFIQFASKSTTVRKLVENRDPEEDILRFIVKSRITFIAGKKESPDDAFVQALIDTLDELSPRSAFKELKQYIRRQLARR